MLSSETNVSILTWKEEAGAAGERARGAGAGRRAPSSSGPGAAAGEACRAGRASRRDRAPRSCRLQAPQAVKVKQKTMRAVLYGEAGKELCK